jgi:hypothetical protein
MSTEDEFEVAGILISAVSFLDRKRTTVAIRIPTVTKIAATY